MVMRDLPVFQTRHSRTHIDAAGNVGRGADGAGSQGVNQGERGAAHARPRDAYRDVPILVKPPWGHDISLYFFAGGVSCGAFVVGTLADLVGGPRRAGLARTAHYVAFAAMAPCPVLLIHDLGRRSRFHHMLRVFKPSSPMNLGAWALSAHGAFATVTAAHALCEEVDLPVVGSLLRLLPRRALAAAGIPSALTLGGYTGVLLGTSSVPLWMTSPLLGGLFMASSLSTGAAAVTLAAAARRGGHGGNTHDEGVTRLDLALSATEVAALAGYLATSGKAVTPLLHGVVGLVMATATAGIVATPLLEAAGLRAEGVRTGRLGLVAAAVTLASGVLLRYGIVFGGHKSALDRAATLTATEPSRRATGWGARATR